MYVVTRNTKAPTIGYTYMKYSSSKIVRGREKVIIALYYGASLPFTTKQMGVYMCPQEQLLNILHQYTTHNLIGPRCTLLSIIPAH